MDGDGEDPVTLDQPVHDVEAVGDAPKDGVMAVEVRLPGEGEEVLAAAGVGAGEGHADGTPLVAPAIELVADGVAGTAVAVAAGVAVLGDEGGDDAVDARAGEDAGAGEV